MVVYSDAGWGTNKAARVVGQWRPFKNGMT
jgi:hypothetical protein